MCEVALHIDHQRRRQDRMSGTNFQQHFSAYRYMQPWLTQLPVSATALRVRAGSEGGRKSLAAKQTGGQGQTQQSRKSSQGSVHVSGGAASQLSDELEADIPVRGRRSSAGKMKVDTQVSCCCCCCFVDVCVYSLFLCLRLLQSVSPLPMFLVVFPYICFLNPSNQRIITLL
jgi:hypothetical protein